jgi:uncharacterized coiled-coil DUF342 family protein
VYTDTDPTPAHGTPRPSKFRSLDRLHHALLTQRLDNLNRIATLTQQITEITDEITKLIRINDDLTADINDIEQLLLDMAP